ncbi:integrase [Elizabethkingia anophelis]|uniref:phage integrase SAM-like domain-containing protein n=1 Tax=Elizabethkingia anophelis TaxID=1117645 RepID=UPI002935BDC3|nr:integrase [Elizabethkingia anophelis]MDV3471504.1 integrase [Elizabethkingia anophelis]MDV3903462.1 integrase [Elizabethkingia anophelis]
MANIEFKVYSEKEPINLNIRFYHNQIDLSTKSNIFIDKTDFRLKRTGVGKKSKTTVNIINEEIKEITEALYKKIMGKFKEDFPKGNNIDKKWLVRIIDDFHNKATDADDIRYFLTPFISDYIENAKRKINPRTGKLLDSKTITRYNYTLNKIKEYEEYIGEKIRLANVDLDFHNDFLHYLLEICVPYGEETIRKFISHIRQFVNDAKLQGFKTNPEIDSPKFTFKAGETIDTYLNEQEIEALFDLDLRDNERLDNTRDLFIAGLRTGLRISDLKRMNTFEISGNKIQIAEIEKTNSYIEIPLHPQLKFILEKREGRFPELSEQRFNENVKDLCREAGIDEIILGSLKSPETKRKVKGYYPKYKLIASHTCRRSFVTNLYGKLPDLSIMAITGHKKHSQFLDYVKITNKEHVDKLEKYWEEQERLKSK